MLAEIERIALEYDVPLQKTPVHTALSSLAPQQSLKKKDLAAALAHIYPQLYYHLAPFPTPQWKYWQPMMEAIGVGLTYSLQLERLSSLR